MSLSLYKKKRDFLETPEPSGKEKSSAKALRFVVQKHDASSLHYDFRLEIKGVLKSWAVPKGPSLNTADKRLAMQVEDHPYDYRTFEGIIPEGNYGAGTVIVWDEGTYTPLESEGLSRKKQEQMLEDQWEQGRMQFVLKGEKLKGAFTLFRLKKGGDKSWLLVKKNDAFASDEDITEQNTSVLSGKSIADVAAENGVLLNHPVKGKKEIKKAASATKKTAAKKSATKAKTKNIQSATSEEANQVIKLDKHELQLTNLNKLYWKNEGGTKGDVINHYLRMAPYILPYMLHRPQSLHRYPNGIDAPGFYQKDVQGKVPGWMETHVDFSESTNEEVHYLVCSNEATLIYMANLGCIEMNPWHSRVETVEKPDWCLIDLDPDIKNTFDEVIETALVVKEIMDAAGLKGVCKTSGSTGIHIYIPLAAKYNYDESKQLAETIVKVVNKELPQLTSLERTPAKRKGKIYLDFLQNKQTQTAAAPYSLRPKPGMPVSTPLHWDELKKGLTINTYNINNIFERVKAEGDLFKPVLGRAINLKKAFEILDGLIK